MPNITMHIAIGPRPASWAAFHLFRHLFYSFKEIFLQSNPPFIFGIYCGAYTHFSQFRCISAPPINKKASNPLEALVVQRDRVRIQT